MISRDERQAEAAGWVADAFGRGTMENPAERAARLLEEACELAQAVGVAEDIARRVVAYVWARPAGSPAQELGVLV